MPSRDRQGVPMGLRPTKKDEGARDWCRGIISLDCAFNRAVSPYATLIESAPWNPS